MNKDANKENSLQDNVILLINGLSESGHVLANMLAEQGADVGIIDFGHMPALAHQIQQDVQNRGRRCLILTPHPTETDYNKFAQRAMRNIIDDLGELDSFITYAAGIDSIDNVRQSPVTENGRSAQKLSVFDQYALTKTALEQILAP
jgi:NAD(P)-dependent dehydrogenase (short-subunit alcohol dehydrogenase family)